MRTAFGEELLKDPHLQDAERNLRKCVHCGFCTATCPTYLVLGDERDSPRGRIALMQNMLESNAAPSPETVKHLDRCLSCLGCRTTCPSGVDYASLIDTSRVHIEKHYRRPWHERLLRAFVLRMLMRPRLFGLMARLAQLFQPLTFLLPGKLRAMAAKAPRLQTLLPAHREEISPTSTAARVAILPGCVQREMAPSIDLAARRVLARRNISAVPLAHAGCCGSLALHMGQEELAKSCAREMITAVEAEAAKAPLDAVLINATGCAAFIKDYPRLFADEPEWQARAERFASSLRDFSEIAVPRASTSKSNTRVAYHPPCSLQHGQRIHGLGENLLAAAGYQLTAIPDSHLCCGSAGSYSLLQPEISSELRERKLAAIRTTSAEFVASGNLGCLSQLAGADCVPTVHIAELIDWAEGGPKPPSLD